uniref:Ig-like domain-containing protein n=1 Tax=Leptobrachium leishanense TaxID=445787 RepID=A0A8C5MU96_9ANUR
MRRHNPLRAIFSIFLLQYQAHLDSAQNVMASVGDMATLFCTYSASEGTASMCWGRGVCPISKCNDVIIWTDGIKVTTKPSEKYQLFGDIEKGNVSLTINRVTYSDEGTYCCRVEIPGIFNDIKKEITVRIQEDEDEPVLVAAVYKPDTAPFKKLITTIKPKNTDSTQQLLSPGTHHKIEKPLGQKEGSKLWRQEVMSIVCSVGRTERAVKEVRRLCETLWDSGQIGVWRTGGIHCWSDQGECVLICCASRWTVPVSSAFGRRTSSKEACWRHSGSG